MVDSGLIAICSFISPYRAEREMVRALVGDGEFIEVFVDTPIEECERRDSKGLYSKARAGKIKNFTGIDAPYEVPEIPRSGSTPWAAPQSNSLMRSSSYWKLIFDREALFVN